MYFPQQLGIWTSPRGLGHTSKDFPPLADFPFLLYLVFRGSYYN